MEARREQMVTTGMFLESARNLGIKSLEGVCEIVDNSFDADAWNIRIHIEREKGESLQITFTDDGVGIPREHIDSDGISHQGIPYVLAYGGRIPHPHQEAPVGKFGWGLSQTACCLSMRTEVYTKTADDDRWRLGYYDLRELAEDPDIMLPVEREAEPPWFELPETGTIVCMRDVDRSEYRQPSSVHRLLVANLGRIYRYFLAHGRTITVSFRDGQSHNETQVRINDPLMQMEESREVKQFGKSFEYDEVEMTFDEDHPLGPVLEPDGTPAKLYARFVRLNAESIRRSLKLPLTGAGHQYAKTLKDKAGISSQNSGFSLIRNGREIGYGESLDTFTKAAEHNYSRGEVRFSAALDDLFRIRTNKSRYDLSPPFKEHIMDVWKPTMAMIRTEHVNAMKAISSKKQEDEIPRAEVVASMAAPNLVRKKVSRKEREEARAEINAEVNTKIQEIRKEAEVASKEAITRAKEAEARGDKALAAKAKTESEVILERAERKEERILGRFSFESPCRKEIGPIGTGELFSVRSRGDVAWVKINSETPFYKNVYSQAEKKPELVDLLDLMIFSMSYAEHIQDVSSEAKSNWENARREVSGLASQMVGTMAISSLLDSEDGGDE